MEKAILGIVLIVAVVGIVGVFSRYPFLQGEDALVDGGITGNVVSEPVAEPTGCGSCSGYAPVCASINHRYLTFPNACEAACSGAELVDDVPCESMG
jgi:hypothetical protein